MFRVLIAALGLLGASPASAKTVSFWYGKSSCDGTASDTQTWPDGQFCGGLGKCWHAPSLPTKQRYMKWVAVDGKLYAGYWEESLGDCGTLDQSKFLDYYSETESLKLWAGQCATGYYNNGAKIQAARLDAPCQATGSCSTCVKRGLKNTVTQECKAGAKDAIKSVLQDNLAAIGNTMVDAIIAELDTESLNDLAGQAVGDACSSCLNAIVDWLMEQGPESCKNSESCNGIDYMAGFAMNYMGISGTCAAKAETTSKTDKMKAMPLLLAMLLFAVDMFAFFG